MTPERAYADTFWQLLAPIRPLLEEPSVSEVLINGPERVFVERNGQLERTGCRFAGSTEILAALRSAAQYGGEDLDERARFVEFALPDGARVWAVLPPLACDGPLVRIRRPTSVHASLSALSRLGALPRHAADLLSSRVEAGSNVVVTGRRRCGKTTLLAALAAAIPDGHRLVVVDHRRELRLDREHVVHLDAGAMLSETDSRCQPSAPFRSALSLRPDWILLSELLGAEALALVRIMALRSVRCLTTLEATTAQDALRRLEMMGSLSDVRLSQEAVRSEIAAGLDLVIHVESAAGTGFRVAHAVEVIPSRDARGGFDIRDLFVDRPMHPSSGRAITPG